MKLRQKMVAITMGGALISVLLGTLLVYIFVKNILIENESKKLSSVTGHMVSSASKRFVESYDKLTSFARLLTIELAKPKSKEDLNSFYRLMEKNADGVWRNKKSLFDGQVESGVFLPSNSHENDTQKIQHARIKHIMDSFGASSDKLFENVWYLSLDRSEIIFDKNLPNFVFEQPANNDYTQTPWVTYTLPELNPNREVRFTPPLFDPVPKIWMVSAIYPLYQNEKWIGSIGEDLRLTDVLAFLFKEDQLYKDTQHFLIDNQGNFILAGDWQSNIEANNQLTKLNFESEPRLAELFQKQINNEPQVLSTDLWIQNKQYIAIGMTIKPVNWRYFHVVPVDEIIATTRQLFINLLGMILAVGTLNGLFTFYFSGRNITNRIKILANTMVIYAKVHRGRIADRLSGDDEISQLGLVFDNMANEIDQNIEALSHRNELLQSVFDISQSGYLLFDPQEKVLLANQTLSIILGFPIDSLLNITANELNT